MVIVSANVEVGRGRGKSCPQQSDHEHLGRFAGVWPVALPFFLAVWSGGMNTIFASQICGSQALPSLNFPKVSIADGSRLWMAWFPAFQPVAQSYRVPGPHPPPRPNPPGTLDVVLAMVNP